MKVDVSITLAEAAETLRSHLEEKLAVEVGRITIVSFDKPKVVFEEGGMVTGVEFRHQA